jgi:hypothetical protein
VLPQEKMPNAIAFTLPAGSGDRQNMIQTYINNRRFTNPGHVGHDVPAETLHQIAKLGRLPVSRRRVMGLPEEGDQTPDLLRMNLRAKDIQHEQTSSFLNYKPLCCGLLQTKCCRPYTYRSCSMARQPSLSSARC